SRGATRPVRRKRVKSTSTTPSNRLLACTCAADAGGGHRLKPRRADRATPRLARPRIQFAAPCLQAQRARRPGPAGGARPEYPNLRPGPATRQATRIVGRWLDALELARDFDLRLRRWWIAFGDDSPAARPSPHAGSRRMQQLTILQTSPRSMAFNTARVRSAAWSLSRITDTWFLTVPSLKPSA
ncbi:MAG: hypothetical protein RIR65_164, partial [Planctomycetota bacterium]